MENGLSLLGQAGSPAVWLFTLLFAAHCPSLMNAGLAAFERTFSHDLHFILGWFSLFWHESIVLMRGVQVVVCAPLPAETTSEAETSGHRLN